MVASFSLVATVVGALVVILSRDRIALWGHWSEQFVGLMAAFAVSGVILAVAGSVRLRASLLLLRFVMLHIILYPHADFLGAEYPLALVLGNEIAFHLAPGAAIAGSLVLIITLLIFQAPMPAWDTVISTPDTAELILVALVVIAFLAAVIAVYWLVDQVTEVRNKAATMDESVQRLTDVNVNYQEYARTVERRSSQAERDRITRDLHDTIGHLLITLNMMLQQAKVMADKANTQLNALLLRIEKETRAGIAAIRRTLYELRAGDESDVPFSSALRELATSFERITGVTVKVDFANLQLGPDNAELEGFIYHMAQEAMTNAYKHGRCSRIELLLSQSESSAYFVVLDDGNGSPNVDKGIGIDGMEERAAALGGRVRFQGMPRGFRVSAEIPLRRPGPHDLLSGNA